MSKVQHEEEPYKLLNIAAIKISACNRFHTLFDEPIYDHQFESVGKFHAPAVANVRDNSGSYHIDLNGNSIYSRRFQKTYGFYCNRAAVSDMGYFHIDLNGDRFYKEHYDWVGNYQEDICVVQKNNKFYHINIKGEKLYETEYDYAGDFKDGIAVIRKGWLCTHIDDKGKLLHGKWYANLGIYHKGYAVAEDNGYFHIDKKGERIYTNKYKFLEPFYNDLAYAESFNGDKGRINYSGNFKNIITYATLESKINNISSELVGFWKTYLINAAIEINLLDILPSKLDVISQKINIPEDNIERLLRALLELGIVTLKDELWGLSVKGRLFKETAFLRDIVIMWAKVANENNWLRITDLLKQSHVSCFPTFKDLEVNQELRYKFFSSLVGYAKIDLKNFEHVIDVSSMTKVILFGVGSLSLSQILGKEKLTYFTKDEFSKSFAREYGVKAASEMEEEYDTAIFYSFLQQQENPSDYFRLCKKNNIGRVLVIETILGKEGYGGMVDINILVESGGRLRKLGDWKGILEEFGGNFQVTQLKDWLFVLDIRL